MEENTNCKSVFKDETDANRDQLCEAITQVWIQMINQIERSGMILSGIQ